MESHHPSQEDQGAAEDEKMPQKCSGLCKGASRGPCSEEEEECNIFPQVEVKMQFFTMKMAFFEVQIIVKSCSAYKDASLYQIRCLYLFFYNFFRSTGTELRRRLYVISHKALQILLRKHHI